MLHQLKNRIFLLSSILLLIMCKTNNAQDEIHPEQIIDANFTNWFGGRDGVQGVNYEFTILSTKNISVKNVVINNTKQNFRTIKLNHGVQIIIQNTFTQNAPIVGQENNVNTVESYDYNLPAYIEYYIENTSKNQTIKLPRFTQKNTPLIP
jgi:hypothetical protein